MKKAIVIGIIECLMVAVLLGTVNAANELVVDENGKVGIGTTTPYYNLTIKTQNQMDGLWIIPPDGSVGNVGLLNSMCGNCWNPLVQDGDNMILWRDSTIDSAGAGGLVLGPWSGSYKGLRISHTGYVGIGTAHPTSRLEVAGHIELSHIDPYVKVDNDSKYLVLSGGNGWAETGSTLVLRGKNATMNPHGIEFFTGGSESMKIVANGYVGIGTTNPQDKLDVAGYVRANGSRLASDARWKENIETLGNAINRVTQLRGVSFDWSDPSRGTGQQVGVIAQEVEEIFPQVVHTDSQGYKSVEYSKLVAPLIEAVKALKAENDALKQENRSFKSTIEDIYARIEQLEAGE